MTKAMDSRSSPQDHLTELVDAPAQSEERNSQSNQDLLGGPYAVIESDPGVR